MSKITLQERLRKSGYDLIDGPVRNHKLMQLWMKKGFDQPELYYADILHAFISPVKLKATKDASLTINSSEKNDYAFQIGLTVTQELIQSIGLPNVDLGGAFDAGKKISISYKNAVSEVVPLGSINDFMSQADFLHPNPTLLRHANQNRLLLITGLITAEQLVVELETDKKASNKLLNELKKSFQNKIELSVSKSNTIRMVSGSDRFPIAVKASRIDFDKGQFKGLTLVTDGRDLF